MFCVVLSMYGGGFATAPAYLADLFGVKMVGAIHGRLLTAWSTAGVLGPVLVNYIREYQLDHGVPKAEAYSITMYVLAALLGVGLVCNWRVKPVDESSFVAAEEATVEPRVPAAGAAIDRVSPPSRSAATVLAAWLAVLTPLAWGVWVTLEKAVLLFQ